jgi:long-subunit fatty acid transport protein
MRNLFRILTRILLLAFCLFVAESGVAQGYDDPLTMQGVDHTTLQSAASRATGGTVFGIRDDAGIMFANPAALQTLNGIQLSIGGLQQYEKSRQIQQ